MFLRHQLRHLRDAFAAIRFGSALAAVDLTLADAGGNELGLGTRMNRAGR